MRKVIIPLILVLSGCASAEQIEAKDNAKCTELGFTQGTEAFGNCRLQLMAIRESEKTAGAVARGAAMQNYWNTYNAVTAPYRGR